MRRQCEVALSVGLVGVRLASDWDFVHDPASKADWKAGLREIFEYRDLGIPEEIRDRIFDPFFTTKDVGKGTGQGLAICRDVVVKKQGGKIFFETQKGKGTAFVVRLPIDGQGATSAAA